jgi:hypothetical protein
MIFLTPCDACNRHVLNTEQSCPFCGAAVTGAMRARTPKPPVGRLGRAAMMALSASVAGTTAACGDSEEGKQEREQPASTGTVSTPMPSTSSPGPGSSSPDPSSPAGTMTQMPQTPAGPGSEGMPVTPPAGDPSAVALYGVAILPSEPGPSGTGGQPGRPGIMTPPPIDEPEPMAVAAYGVFPVEPVPPPMMEPSPPPAVLDAGVEAEDSGSAQAEPVMEPEPLPVADYGVPPLEALE